MLNNLIGEEKYSCQFCKQIFYNFRERNKHEERHHRRKMEEKRSKNNNSSRKALNDQNNSQPDKKSYQRKLVFKS